MKRRPEILVNLPMMMEWHAASAGICTRCGKYAAVRSLLTNYNMPDGGEEGLERLASQDTDGEESYAAIVRVMEDQLAGRFVAGGTFELCEACAITAVALWLDIGTAGAAAAAAASLAGKLVGKRNWSALMMACTGNAPHYFLTGGWGRPQLGVAFQVAVVGVGEFLREQSTLASQRLKGNPILN